MTTNDIATKLGKSVRTVQRIISDYDTANDTNTKAGAKTILPGNVIDFLLSTSTPELEKPKNGNPPQRPAQMKTIQAKIETPSRLGLWLVRGAVAALGIRASYGVFVFAYSLVPFHFALIEAFSLELTYIGITFLQLDRVGRKWALGVALGAMFVSILYNVLAAAIMEDSMIFTGLRGLKFWGLAALHGAPMAALAFLVSWFIVQHIKDDKGK